MGSDENGGLRMDVYELEVENLLKEGGNERLKSQFMNLSRRLDEASNENKELKKQISELEAELEKKETLLTMREEEAKTELPTMPIDVASMLINATVEYHANSLQRAFGAGETSFADKYSKSDLREIAEHLLVYCNNSDECEEDFLEELRSRDLNFNLVSKMLGVIELMLTDTQS